MMPTQYRAFQPALIDRLFARFAAMYGNRFADMWAGINIDDVKKCWADELRIFSVDHVGVAIDGLKTRNFPPTLPEFLQLCESARREAPRQYAQERSGMPTDAEMNSPECLAAKARCMATVARLGSTFGAPSNAWAHKLLKRHESGEHLPADSLRMMRNALKWGKEGMPNGAGSP